MTFGEKLQEILDWYVKSQKEVAELSGISQSSISDYVNMKSTPTIDAAQKIADALGVSLWTLLNGDPLAVTPIDLTQRERTLLSEYRCLDQEEREAIDSLLRVLNRRAK